MEEQDVRETDRSVERGQSCLVSLVVYAIAGIVMLLLIGLFFLSYFSKEIGKRMASAMEEAMQSPVEDFMPDWDVADEEVLGRRLQQIVTCTVPEGYVARYGSESALCDSIAILPVGKSCSYLQLTQLFGAGAVVSAFGERVDSEASGPPLAFTMIAVVDVTELVDEQMQQERMTAFKKAFGNAEAERDLFVSAEGMKVIRISTKDRDVYGAECKVENESGEQIYWVVSISPGVSVAAMGPVDGFDEEAVRAFVGSMEVGKGEATETKGGEDCR